MLLLKGQGGPVQVSASGSFASSDPAAVPAFTFHIPSTASPIDSATVRALGETLDTVNSWHARAAALHEFHVLAQHDWDLKILVQKCRFALHDTEKLVLLHLFKTRAAQLSVSNIADALEYVCRYKNIIPASVCCMRFYQSLYFFNPEAAYAFADAFKVAPSLDPEKVFRNIATEHDIIRSHRRIDPENCISYFNQAQVMEGMESFIIDGRACIRKKKSTTSIKYAEAIFTTDEFVRFVLRVYTEPRYPVLDIIAKNGAGRSLCYSLIRSYLQHHGAEEAVLLAEMQATVHGSPPFVSTPKFLAEKGSAVLRAHPLLRLAQDSAHSTHTEGSTRMKSSNSETKS